MKSKGKRNKVRGADQVFTPLFSVYKSLVVMLRQAVKVLL